MPQTCYYVTSKTDVYIHSISGRLVCFVAGDDEVNDLPQTISTRSFTCILFTYAHQRRDNHMHDGQKQGLRLHVHMIHKVSKIKFKDVKDVCNVLTHWRDPVHVSEVRVEEDIDSRE